MPYQGYKNIPTGARNRRKYINDKFDEFAKKIQNSTFFSDSRILHIDEYRAFVFYNT